MLLCLASSPVLFYIIDYLALLVSLALSLHHPLPRFPPVEGLLADPVKMNLVLKRNSWGWQTANTPQS